MENNCYSYVIILLVYRNYADLEECLQNFENKINDTYKCVVVNAYYDEESKNRISEIANRYNADFLNEKNNGYGYGNNRGIEHATKLYIYDYIIVSNPDVLVKEFIGDSLEKGNVYAPIIKTRTGKSQNPFLVIKNKAAAFLEYYGYKYNIKPLIYMGIVINKVIREACIRANKNKEISVFAAHGCFVIFGGNVIEKMDNVYDENIFLFGEEVVLAYKLEKLGIMTKMTNNIEIYHKEDGSMKLADFSMYSQCRKSNMYIYDNYIKGE